MFFVVLVDLQCVADAAFVAIGYLFNSEENRELLSVVLNGYLHEITVAAAEAEADYTLVARNIGFDLVVLVYNVVFFVDSCLDEITREAEKQITVQ